MLKANPPNPPYQGGTFFTPSPDKGSDGEGFAFLPYNKNLTALARENRKNPTKAESKIWNEILRNREFTKYKFIRQKPIDEYIVDFYCSELCLVIEIDGDSHATLIEYDLERTKILEAYGLSVVRYTNEDVLYNIEGVYDDLVRRIATPTVLLDSFGDSRFPSSWRFDGYVKTVVANNTTELIDVLNQVEQAATDGLYAAGFVAFEAAAALNSDLPSMPPLEGLPLAWFAIFRERYTVEPSVGQVASALSLSLEPTKNAVEYAKDVELIQNYIAAGDSYQVNHTFLLEGRFEGNLQDLYNDLGAAQKASFCAYLDTGRFKILSASPELFFSLKDGKITTRPMKGTASRGRWTAEDLAAIEALRNSPKEMAENLMIVDLLRNDLGILAETGSVTVDALFEVETYPTVHQMTSAISAQLPADTSLIDIFRALFPCGSVTGAPKRRSMEIIAELENAPRGVYCGAIGCVAPGGETIFSVAIRTLLLDKQTNKLTMGVGSAVTWDSVALSEYEECLKKGLFVNQKLRDFKLIESLRLENGNYTLLERHLARLTASASYFSFRCNIKLIRQKLVSHALQRVGVCKVRTLLSADGAIHITSEPIEENSLPLRVALSTLKVHSSDQMLYHKTTRRGLFDEARASHRGSDEILLQNENGQLTEGSYHSLILKLDGKFVTPPLDSGLLPGVLREELLENGEISEQILYPKDLERATEIWLINSVRGWRKGVIQKHLFEKSRNNFNLKP